jgi:hypothetical protein
MPKERISRNEYLQLVGLLTVSRRHVRLIQEIAAAIGEVVGDPNDNEGGWIGDAVWDANPDVDQMLERMKITVEPEASDADS